MLARIRRAPKAPLSVAGILATPLFFVALMAFSLRLDEPTVHVSASGAEVLRDPLKSTVALIYLASFGVCALVVLAGVVSSFVPAPGGVFVPALVAIVTSIVLRLPLDIWEVEHTARYPQGVDLIPKSDPGDLFLRGEWEENARRTAEQLGFWTIAMAIAAMVIATAIEVRRRRGVTSPPVLPPPPEATMHVG